MYGAKPRFLNKPTGKNTLKIFEIYLTHETTMARDHVSKIFDLESAFEAGSEKSTKGGNNWSKNGHRRDMELKGTHEQRIFEAKYF